ncbi:MAG: hypothetical protein U0X93_02840 [Anaerolineales bacterium]
MQLISRFFFPLFVLTMLYLLISRNLLSSSSCDRYSGPALALGIWARRTFQAGQFSTGAETKEGQLLMNDLTSLFVIPFIRLF